MTNDEILEVLRKTGLRITPQRLAIYEWLAGTSEHPTAVEIFDHLKGSYPSLSLATVYNTLDVLAGIGAITAIGSVGDRRVHFDANLSEHINLVCEKCHRIIDVVSDRIKQLDSEIAFKSGYQISGSSILYSGVCPQCQASFQ